MCVLRVCELSVCVYVCDCVFSGCVCACLSVLSVCVSD